VPVLTNNAAKAATIATSTRPITFMVLLAAVVRVRPQMLTPPAA
jgi:hypothetical protein